MENIEKTLYDLVYDRLFAVMNSFYPLSVELRELIYDHSTLAQWDKGDLLQEEDKECSMLFFVAKGFCFCFYNKDGKECIMRFIKEKSFCTAWHSFLGKQSSLIGIKATEPTIGICFNREQFDLLWEKSTDFIAIMCKVLQLYVVESEEIHYRMRSNHAEDRVRYYMDTHEIQYLMKHVPRYSIASYLNMTQETFSKIFSLLNKEQKNQLKEDNKEE